MAFTRFSGSLDTRRAAYLLALSLTAFVIVRLTSRHTILGDLDVYRAEGMTLRHGAPLYAHLHGVHNLGTYPPFAAVMFVLLTLVPFPALEVLCLIVNLLLLALVCYLGCRLAGLDRERSLVPVLVFTAIATWSEPIFTTFAYGQINLLLLSLVLWDFTRPAGHRWRGVGVGIAAGWKVTPAIFIVYLLLTRRFRDAGTAALTFAATVALSAAIDWHDTWRYWTHYLFQTARVGNIENPVNQTLRGVAVRAGHSLHVSPAVVALIGLVLVVGLALSVLAYRRFGDAWGLPAAAVVGLLTSPISWSHHWVWALPIAILFWAQARRWLIASVAAFMTWAVWYASWLSDDWLHLSPAEIAASTVYVVFGLGFLCLTAVRVRTATRVPESRVLVRAGRQA